jgi:hypothetical protein
MDGTMVRMALVVGIVSGSLVLWVGDMPGQGGMSGVVFAADGLKVEGLPNDPKQFRAQVDQILTKVDSLIKKLKANPKVQAVVLDLMQTRDNVLREISKIDSAPGDAKWTAQEMRDSVQAMLKLLKEQYDKAAGTAG